MEGPGEGEVVEWLDVLFGDLSYVNVHTSNKYLFMFIIVIKKQSYSACLQG